MAAPYMEDGGHHGVPFFQPTDQFPGLEWGNSFGEPANTFTSNQSILNPAESARLTDFFTDPNNVDTPANEISFNWAVVDEKPSGGSMGGPMGDFGVSSQTIRNPAATLAGSSSSHYQAQATSRPAHMASHAEYAGNEYGQGSEDDIEAASGLYTMFMHGNGNSRAFAPPEASVANPWGGYESGGGLNNVQMQDHITSPMTSSGRQSAESYHGHPSNTFMNNQLQGEISQLHPGAAQAWHQLRQQQHLPQNIPRARHGSLQLDANPFNFMPASAQQMQMSTYNRSQRPAPPMRFGSDDNFGRTGYHGPSSSVSLEQEKGGNLINVPLAAQAAANGLPHVHQHVPYMTQQLQYSHHPVTGSSRPFQNMSAASSPGAHMGGLPLSSPQFGAQNHGHPYRPVAPQKIKHENEDYSNSDEDAEFQQDEPRKRRKSLMERNEEAEYNPSGHVKATVSISRRDARPSKNVVIEDSDSDYQTPGKTSSGKRRKSSMAGMRPSLISSNSNSPSALNSPASKQTPTSNKKKGRDTEPRKNLSEDQKRQNHIQSEKHRRDLIKNQYDALDNLVPGLKGGKSGLSRSDVLQEIVAYVESIMNGNAHMDRLLDEMEDMEVADAPHVDGDEVV